MIEYCKIPLGDSIVSNVMTKNPVIILSIILLCVDFQQDLYKH